jgi:hypothetical protein
MDDLVTAALQTDDRGRALGWLWGNLVRDRGEDVVRHTLEIANARRHDYEADILDALQVLNTPAVRAVLTVDDVRGLAHTCWSDEGIRFVVAHEQHLDAASLAKAIGALERETHDAGMWRRMRTPILKGLRRLETDDERKEVLRAVRHEATLDHVARALAADVHDVSLEPTIRYLLHHRTRTLSESTRRALETYMETVYAPVDPVPPIVRASRDSFVATSTMLDPRRKRSRG